MLCGVERAVTYSYAQPVAADDRVTVGKNIKRLREAAGHEHQGDFADRIGKRQQWLSDVEVGRVGMPDAGNLLLIATAIPCTLDALFEGVDSRFDASRAGDLLCHSADQRSRLLTEVDVESTTARLLEELAAKKAVIEILVREVSNAARELGPIVSRLAEIGETGSPPPARGGGRRKSG